MEGFLDLVDFSQNADIFHMMYPVIREHKPAFFAERLKNTVNNFIRGSILKQPSLEEFMAVFATFMDEFRDVGFDDSVDDNIRWAIANKILGRVLEWCSLEQLEAVMLKYFAQFQESLGKQFEPSMSPLQRYLLIREKTHLFLFLETMVRRIDADRIKGEITRKLYGQMCKGNELTTYLIVTASKAKMHEIDGFMSATRDAISSVIPILNSPYQVQRRYICAAYNLLSSVILKTQSSQKLFSTYLFNTKAGCEPIWQLLIDCSTEDIYRFEVQTNFNIVSLKRIEHKIAQYNTKESQVHNLDFNKTKANNFLNEYVTTSFMSANEKFNSAMVFETQLDEAGMRSEKQKVDEILRKRMSLNPEMGFHQTESLVDLEMNIDAMQDASAAQSNNDNEERKDSAENAARPSEGKKDALELDVVNRHECMKNLKRCLDRMQELFSA